MKILYFVKTFANPTLTFIYNEIHEISKHHEVLVITLERRNAELFPLENVIEVSYGKAYFPRKILQKLQYADFEFSFKSKFIKKHLSDIIEKFNPDIIHTHFGFESWYFLENFSNIKNIPVFISFHGFDASHKLNSLRYRNTVLKWNVDTNVHFIFVSNFMLKNIQNKIGETINRANILYYGTDVSFFSSDRLLRNNTPNIPKVFLQISSFAEKKGHYFTVKAFEVFIKKYGLSEQDVQLIFAGDGLTKDYIMDLVKSLHLEKFIHFEGLVTHFRAKELMQKANYFIHHSVTSASVGDMEGIPNALMEAMAMELPVVSTYHSGIPELVEDGVNGYLVPERDIDQYAEKLQQILQWDYASKNREKVIELFEKEKHCQLLQQIYRNVIIELNN